LGLAVAEAYVESQPDVEVQFVGAPSGVEERHVPQYGLEFMPVIGLPKYNQRGVRLAIGLGGYASGAPMLAAKTLGIKSVLVEPNSVPGLTNRWLGEVADAVFLGHEQATPAFAGTERRVVGTPVRRSIATLGEVEKAPPDLARRAACLLVIGGSKGHDFFSKIAPELACAIRRRGVPLEVLHHAGDSPVEPIRAAYEACGISADVRPFFDDIAHAYARADFALARSGAVTLGELAASRVPAVIVPWPSAADDHQAKNATDYCVAGGAFWSTQTEWNGEAVADRIASLLRDASAWRSFSNRAHQKARFGAARAVVRECERLMSGHW
jgi:UDP-N-acetylglucosamine--N-acetylmuramyl-(pentapeptide) pyrophosphoryl-undecaprenol N-acetylglucosamine transferase